MITGTGGEVRRKTLMIAGVMSLKHGDAEGFFRAKVVIKRPFRHLGGFEQFAKPHAGKTPLHTKLLAGGQQMFAGIMFGLLIHSRQYSRPVGLLQAELP
ncbi:Uncharacterised protein [Salmonella enterica subsp. enterica serovar Pullorum]|nr:Uncharacterised protein [Salmonella enterica subsp. enterica serovar Pullorum]